MSPVRFILRLARRTSWCDCQTGEHVAAEMIGDDTSRMLTLLKVEVARPLTACTAASLEQIRVGQWAIAVGRSLRADSVSMSVGVISGLGRKHGRVLQTDANVSAANYGGPLLDIDGKAIGILVPMSPQSSGSEGDSAVAGAEFYDSGIGFAVPLQHVVEVLPRWIEQKELRRGVLGVSLRKGSPYTTEPVIESIWPNSPASTARWQPGDTIVAVDGVEVETQNQLRLQLASRYARDAVSVRLRRAQEGRAGGIRKQRDPRRAACPLSASFLGRSADATDAPG